VFEIEALRGFSHVRPTEVHMQFIEKAE